MRIPNLSDIPEQKPVPEGEYRLRIVKATEIKSERTGRSGIQFICRVLDDEDAQPVFHSLWLPFDSEDDEKRKTMWRMVKEFMDAIGVDSSSEPELQDFVGVEFDALLKIDEYEGRVRNEIARVI